MLLFFLTKRGHTGGIGRYLGSPIGRQYARQDWYTLTTSNRAATDRPDPGCSKSKREVPVKPSAAALSVILALLAAPVPSRAQQPAKIHSRSQLASLSLGVTRAFPRPHGWDTIPRAGKPAFRPTGLIRRACSGARAAWRRGAGPPDESVFVWRPSSTWRFHDECLTPARPLHSAGQRSMRRPARPRYHPAELQGRLR